jgi:mono/diheme cytochrome c family protein
MLSYSKNVAFAWCLVSVAGLACVLAGSAVALQAQAKTTKDSVYSAAQSKRGEALYQTKCASCHGKNLAGDVGPALAGPDFVGFWDKMALSELVDKISTTMPEDAPGSITRPQAADLVAFILQTNKYPAGTADLSSENGVLKTIAIAK